MLQSVQIVGCAMGMTLPSAQQGAAARQQMPLLRTRQPISHSFGRMQLQQLSSSRSKVQNTGDFSACTAQEPPAPKMQLQSSVVQLEAARLAAACSVAFNTPLTAAGTSRCMVHVLIVAWVCDLMDLPPLRGRTRAWPTMQPRA